MQGIQKSWRRISKNWQADRRFDSGQSDRLVDSMTGDQSRLLKAGDRVRWGLTTTDFGTIVGTSWSGVTIEWDDGHTASIQHNDMARIERVPANLV
jgi:hypothetical protein